MPTKGTIGAAAFDVYVPINFEVRKGRNIIPLGFAIELEKGTYAEIRPRSGFSAKGIEDINGIRHNADVLHGLIDEDYRNVVGVIVKANDTFVIAKGTRIAQMLICKYENVSFEEVEELSETERGNGGFGSTGTK